MSEVSDDTVLELSFAEIISLNDLTVTRSLLGLAANLATQTLMEEDEVQVLRKMPIHYQTRVRAELLGIVEDLRDASLGLDAALLGAGVRED